MYLLYMVFTPRGKLCAPPASLGSINASRMAFCVGGPAAWDPLPRGFASGSGPTIAHARGHMSTRSEDIALVVAVGQGNLEEVLRLLNLGTSGNTRVLNPIGAASRHATTALHTAAARADTTIVHALLEARTDPSSCQSGLRMLTPLHEAATVPVAEMLMNAGAQPSTKDPREPDFSWYHQQRGRPDVAKAIVKEARARTQQAPHQLPSFSVDVRPDKVFPCMTAAETSAARQAWSMPGWIVLDFAQRGFPEDCDDDFDFECSICMAAVRSDDKCMMLPCGGEGSGPGQARCASVPPDGGTSSGRPHFFHSECLEAWWLKSCRCPTCRRDVRRWLSFEPQISPKAVFEQAPTNAICRPCGRAIPAAPRRSMWMRSDRTLSIRGRLASFSLK